MPRPTQQSSSKVQALMPLQVHCPALFTAMLPAVGPFFACPRPLGGVVVAARAPARASGGRLRWRLRAMCTKACAPRGARRRSSRISAPGGPYASARLLLVKGALCKSESCRPFAGLGYCMNPGPIAVAQRGPVPCPSLGISEKGKSGPVAVPFASSSWQYQLLP